MGYRTILVYLDGEDRAPQLIEAAAAVARKSDAHLIGLYVIPRLFVAPAIALDVPAEVIERQRRLAREEGERVKALFTDKLKAETFVSEWRMIESRGWDVAHIVIEHGRVADLIMCGQMTDAVSPERREVPERALMESGRPVLIVPALGRFPTVGDHAMVAWNASREAARAVFDAVPLLASAKMVRVLWVNPPDGNSDGSGNDLPGSALAEALARHDIAIEATHTITSEIGIGDELLSRLADHGSDLLVMGGYGHSKLREFVFGGATEHILEHMTAPVLMSH